MSYQRPDGNGRHYIWMGSDGLHNMHDGLLAHCTFHHGPVGRDNAKAMMRGLTDFLAGEGLTVKMRHGQPTFVKTSEVKKKQNRKEIP